MKKYKTRADIKYVDFEKFNDAIDEHDEDAEYIAETIMLIFYPKEPTYKTEECIKEFNKAFNAEGKIQNYRLDLNLKKASRFIDCDTLMKDSPIDFLEYVVKSYIPFRKVDVNKISLSTAQHVFKLFTNEPPK